MTVLEITAPQIKYDLLLPFLLIFGGACVGVLLEAALPRSYRLVAQLAVTFAAILGGLFLTVRLWLNGWTGLTGVGSLAIDRPT